MRAKGSANAVRASWNDTPCFEKLDTAFLGSHSNFRLILRMVVYQGHSTFSHPPLSKEGLRFRSSDLVLIYPILILSNCVILNFSAAPPGSIVNWCNVNSCS